MRYLAAFALTLLIEVPIVTGLLTPRPRPARAVLVCVVANLATHPLVWWLLHTRRTGYWPWFVGCEISAWLVESVIVAAAWPSAARRQAPLVVLIANAASCLVGLLVTR